MYAFDICMNVAKKRLRRKLLLVFVAPVVLGLFVTGVVSIKTTREALFKSNASSLASNVATFRAAAFSLSKDELRGLVTRVAQASAMHAVALYDEEGRAVARSDALDRDLAAIDSEIALVVTSQMPVERVLFLNNEKILLRAEPVRDMPGIGVALMTRELASMEAAINLELIRLALTGGTAALVISALTFLMSRLLGREWSNLASAAERVAKGELDVQVEASSTLELDRVGRAFNEMTRSLVEAREKLFTADADRIEQAVHMRRAQALAVVGQVAGSFAHEIGSPLNTILGWSRLSASDETLPPAVRKQFETIATQSERITRIVERMLAVARPAKEQVGPVDLADVVREVTTFLAPELRVKRIDLRILVAESTPTLIGTRDRLIQVVMNLCFNAIQAQPQGGCLRITLAPEDTSALGEPSQIKLEVADAGPGIAEEDYAKIFEPFYSTKADRGGTGLGLPIVADIIREIGGTIEVAKAPEGGALFRVNLPKNASASTSQGIGPALR